MLNAAVKIYRSSDEWSALYINGKLDCVGDHYIVEERIHDLLEIEVKSSNSFMLGNSNARRDQVAQTEAEILSYDLQREDAQRRVNELQEEMLALRKKFNLR